MIEQKSPGELDRVPRISYRADSAARGVRLLTQACYPKRNKTLQADRGSRLGLASMQFTTSSAFPLYPLLPSPPKA